MGLEVRDTALEVNEDEGVDVSSSNTAVRFEVFCEAFRCWQTSTTFLDALQRNEYAVTLLSTSNLRPLHFCSSSENDENRVNFEEGVETHQQTQQSSTMTSSPTSASVQLVVHAPCCGVSVALSEDEQLTLAQTPRVFPIRAAAGYTGKAATDLSAQCTQLDRQQRIIEHLFGRAHVLGCPWRDNQPLEKEKSGATTTPAAAAAVAAAASVVPRKAGAGCSVRQLLLGGPSLSLTESALVRAYCAAVALRPAASGATDAQARTRCLLPRGSPPSVMRTCAEEAMSILRSGSHRVACDGKSQSVEGAHHLPRLRYIGSNVNDRILQLFFSPKKRLRPEAAMTAATGSDTAVNDDVILEYMGLLISLYGYTLAPHENTRETATAAISEACDGTAEAFDGPPVVISSEDTKQEDNTRTHIEVTRQQRTLSAEAALRLLGRRINCRYCAHGPWVSAQQVDLTTTATTTVTTMTTVVSNAEVQPSTPTGGEASPQASDAHDETAEDVEATLIQNEEEEEKEEENCGGVGSPSSMEEIPVSQDTHGDDEEAEAEHDGGDVEVLESAEESNGDEEEGTSAPSLFAADGEHESSKHALDEEHVKLETSADANAAMETVGEASCTAEGGEVQSSTAPTASAITTITKAVTATTTRTTTASTTTITVTFSNRSTDTNSAGHQGCCPWHRLFLSDAIDATALATAERRMDFSWVVEDDEGKPACMDEGTGEYPSEDVVKNALIGASADASDTVCPTEDLTVTGTAMTLHAEGAEHQTDNDVSSTAVESASGVGHAAEETVEKTHTTVLVFRFFQSEVERLISAWRLSEEWERLRPAQYLQHPLWHTWSTASVLHPIHTEAADGMMEQFLRGLERRLSSHADREEAEDDVERTGKRAAYSNTPSYSLGTTEDIVRTIGAPLYQAPRTVRNKTAEGVLRVAQESIGKCFASSSAPAANQGMHNTQSACARLAEALRTVGTQPPAAGNEEASETSAVDAFLRTAQQRYQDEQTTIRGSPELRLREALLRSAVPRVVYPFTSPHYCSVRIPPADDIAAGISTSSRTPAFTIDASPSSAAAAAASSQPASALHAMTSAESASVVKFLQEFRRTSEEEQRQLQRAREAEAQRVASAAAAEAAAATAAAAAAASKGTPQAPGMATVPLHSSAATQKPMTSAPQVPPRSQPHTRQSPQQPVFAGAHPRHTNSGSSSPHPPMPDAPLSKAAVYNKERWSGGHNGGGAPVQPVVANAAAMWSAGSPAPPQPPFAFDAPGGPAQTVGGFGDSNQPVFAQGGGVMDDLNNAVFSGNFPFGWSPLATGLDEMGGGILSASSGGGLPLPSAPSPPLPTLSATLQSPPPVFFGGYNAAEQTGPPPHQQQQQHPQQQRNDAPSYRPVDGADRGFGGGRMSRDRGHRNTFVLGSANASSGSVLSSGSGGEDVRLSNWSSTTNTAPAMSGGGGGGVLQGDGGGVLSSAAPFSGGMHGGNHTASGGTTTSARPAASPVSASVAGQSRGGLSTGAVTSRGRGGGGGGGARPHGLAGDAGGHYTPGSALPTGGNSNNNTTNSASNTTNSASMSNTGRAILGDNGGGGGGGHGGGRGGGRGRGRGGAPWRGGGGGGGRGGHRRGGN